MLEILQNSWHRHHLVLMICKGLSYFTWKPEMQIPARNSVMVYMVAWPENICGVFSVLTKSFLWFIRKAVHSLASKSRKHHVFFSGILPFFTLYLDTETASPSQQLATEGAQGHLWVLRCVWNSLVAFYSHLIAFVWGYKVHKIIMVI